MSVSCNCPDCITAIWVIDCFLYGTVLMCAQQLVAVSILIFMCYLYICCCLLNKINYIKFVPALFSYY